ncbi:MAG: DUF4856 domain-containing protein [Tenacibaculum sp.]
MKKLIFISLFISAFVFTSCSDDNDEVILPTTTAPESYVFEREGESTVNFAGQTSRIKMAEELTEALLDNANTFDKLDKMYKHKAGDNDFSDSELNTSDRNVRSKIAASKDYFESNSTEATKIRELFDSYIKKQVEEVFPNWNKNAKAGEAGVIQEAGGGTKRYVNAKGLEYNQAFAKSLIGAMIVDQMLNHYLSKNRFEGATEDNNAVTLVEGQNYTNMEHWWDEAYGYLYGKEVDEANPVLGSDDFLSKYLKRVQDDIDFQGIAKEIFDAFKLGRAAIVNKDYTLRDEQANIIKAAISKVIAVRAVYYLQAGKDNLANNKAAAFHNLSEGYGFIHSLRFTQNPETSNPYFTPEEVNEMLEKLQAGNGFWDIKKDDLQSISADIATKFDFTVEQAKN